MATTDYLEADLWIVSKNEGTAKAYKKSRLVVQGFNDMGKRTILTQAPTIQRVSQRLLLCLFVIIKPRLQILLRDISQAYVQSTSFLNREFFVKAPRELGLDDDHVLLILKPLYGIPEAGNHWYYTYHKHFEHNLHMEESTYDSCLLISKSDRSENFGFGIIGLQTDDTLILCDEKFAAKEEIERQRANFIAKPVTYLTKMRPINFNGSNISLDEDGNIMLTQQNHCNKIRLINQNDDIKSQYISQRALGAYIATVCQPEASFDLSRAAQVINPETNDVSQLNKRLTWQKSNQTRGLKFVPLDYNSLKILVFTDGSFANCNEDMTSQIGFVICLADNSNKANIVHWSSTKCKRVTRSVLSSELYAMVIGFDMATVIKSTIEKIFKSTKISSLPCRVPLILCTDSRSLYECLSKLGTTTEKRLMIDIMAIRQSYEHREVTEIRWIAGSKNPADALTKGKACSALKKLIDRNEIDISTDSWVEICVQNNDLN